MADSPVHTYISCGVVGAHRYWDKLAVDLGHKTVEVGKLAVGLGHKTIEVTTTANKSLRGTTGFHKSTVEDLGGKMSAVESADSIYMVGNYIDGKVLGVCGFVLDKVGKGKPVYMYDMRSNKWMVMNGTPKVIESPRPSGKWTGLGPIAISPKAIEAIRSLSK
jgi:hypothetical protein